MARLAKPKKRRSKRLYLYIGEGEYAELVRRAEALVVPVPPSTLAAQILSEDLQKKPRTRKR